MKRWYLVYCKRGEQLRAKGHLENQGVECYYPQIKVEKIHRDKIKQVIEPLFPSYMFIRFNYQEGPTFTTVRSTRGVVDFVRFGSEPAVLSDELVDDLKLLDNLAQEYCRMELPHSGQEIEIKSGQFCGIKAIYQEPDGDARSVMLVKMIDQPVRISIENKHLDLKYG